MDFVYRQAAFGFVDGRCDVMLRPCACDCVCAGKAKPAFAFVEGRCDVMLTLDLREGTLRFAHGGRSIGTIAAIKGPLHAAATLTHSSQSVSITSSV